MAHHVEAIVNPELLVWARETAGLSIETVATKIKQTSERLSDWERGESRPTIPQLRELARTYKRPLAVFYLSAPPRDFQSIRDYRRLPGEVAGKESPALRIEIRRAHFRREVALDLYQALGIEPITFAMNGDPREDPEALAGRLRDNLGITYEEQVSFADQYTALSRWRTAFEERGILVFQASGVEREEMRGFSIGQYPLPAIVMNSKDSARARIFSMLHELTHLAVRRAGLCDFEEEGGRPPEEQGMEVFCNRVAGAILIPMDCLLAEDLVQQYASQREWDDRSILSLSRRYEASRETLLRRLLIAQRISVDFYRKKRQQYAAESRGEQSGGPPQYKQIINRSGPNFVRLVLSAYYQEKITSSDVAEFLDTRLKHLGKVEESVMGRAIEFGAVA